MDAWFNKIQECGILALFHITHISNLAGERLSRCGYRLNNILVALSIGDLTEYAPFGIVHASNPL